MKSISAALTVEQAIEESALQLGIHQRLVRQLASSYATSISNVNITEWLHFLPFFAGDSEILKIDWDGLLGTEESIDSSTWTPAAGISVSSEAIVVTPGVQNTKATVTIASATTAPLLLKNTITTSESQTLTRTVAYVTP